MGETLTDAPALANGVGISLQELRSSRLEALAAGDKLYFDSANICKRGHAGSPRYAASAACVECVRFLNQKRKLENPTEARDRKREFRVNHPGVHAARARSYRSRNIEKVRAAEASYRKSNPEKKKVKDANRRARKKGSAGSYTIDDINAILTRQKFKCACCSKSIRKKKDRHIDHIVPLAKGGSNWSTNIQMLCVACNLSKGDRLPEKFMRARGFLI